jgi:hypothetical protein
MVRIMPDQITRGAACAASPVLGLAMAARQRQDLSRHFLLHCLCPELARDRDRSPDQELAAAPAVPG